MEAHQETEQFVKVFEALWTLGDWAPASEIVAVAALSNGARDQARRFLQQATLHGWTRQRTVRGAEQWAIHQVFVLYGLAWWDRLTRRQTGRAARALAMTGRTVESAHHQGIAMTIRALEALVVADAPLQTGTIVDLARCPPSQRDQLRRRLTTLAGLGWTVQRAGPSPTWTPGPRLSDLALGLQTQLITTLEDTQRTLRWLEGADHG